MCSVQSSEACPRNGETFLSSRWVLCANHTEPVKGFLGRFLRRKLMETEISGRVRNVELVKIIDWIPKVWHHLNRFLEAHSSSDVTIGRWEASQGTDAASGALAGTALGRHKSARCRTVHTDEKGTEGWSQPGQTPCCRSSASGSDSFPLFAQPLELAAGLRQCQLPDEPPLPGSPKGRAPGHMGSTLKIKHNQHSRSLGFREKKTDHPTILT